MVVNVESDLVVPTEIDTIRLDVAPARGKSTSQLLPLAAAASAGHYVLPVSVALVPSGAPQLSFTVTAVGLLGGATVVQQAVTGTFAPGQAQQFDLFLSRSCVASPSLCATKAADVRPFGGASDGGAGGHDGGGVDAGVDHAIDAATDHGGGDAGDGPNRALPGTWKATSGITAQTTLNSVWARPADVWAVGYAGSAGQIWHFDGTSWKLSTDVPAGTGVLYGVWAASASETWAVGAFATILHRVAGGSWVSVSAPLLFSGTLSGVWGSGSSDVWAVGTGGNILHWDGTVWSQVPSAATKDLLSVSGAGTSDEWAVGLGGAVLQGAGNLWTSAQSPTQNVLYSVWENAANDVWTVGADGAFHFDGNKWSSSAGVSKALAVWSSGASDAWAAGSGGGIAHFDGTAWLPAPSATTEDLLGASGSSATDVWAVGNHGAAVHYTVP
jgi:hypothetical protein